MADQVLKTVRITDNIKVEVLQQGKKRKYALFYDGDTEFITKRGRGSYEETDKNNNTKSEKYDIAMSDDDVIEMALKAYNSRFGSYSKKWYITQKVYSDPAPARTYGNGDKSPYYLNNGCAINIQWVGKIPNPEFNPGTYSNLNDAEKAGKRAGKPRYLDNVNVISTTDDAMNFDNLPKSSWSVSPPVIFDDDLFGNSGTGTLVNAGQEVPVDYRDKSYVQKKIVTVTLPKGFTENGGKGYLVWTQDGLEYDSKAIPEKIVYYYDHNKDSYIVEQVINRFLSKVLFLHNDLPFPYDLKLCAPDNETCSLIPYKSPLEAPDNTPQQAAINDIPPPPPVPIQSGKLKLSIQGLFENEDGTTPGSTASVFEIKAKTNMPAFIVWSGEIPKTEEIDQFENLPELDEEYSETGFSSVEEDEIVFVNGAQVASFSSEELKRDINESVPDGSGGDVNRGDSNVKTPGGAVSSSSVSLPTDLSKVQNSSVITKQSIGGGKYRSITSDIKAPSGKIINGAGVTKCMNEFVTDVLGPFATFLKSNYPSLYKGWYITSATRGYIPSGGSLNSQHLQGQAIDSQILGATARTPGENIKLLNAILTWYQSNPLGYGQLLFETRGNSCWIHWSYKRGNDRLMFARFKSDTTLRSASANTTGKYVKPPLTASSLGL